MMPEPNEFVGLAWDQFWQVTFVAVAVGLLLRLFSRRQPHLAYVLWLLVIVKCLTPPIFSSPTGVFGWVKLQGIGPRAQETLDHAVTWTVPAQPPEGAETSLPSAETAQVSRESVAGPAQLPMQMTTGLLILWLFGVATCAAVVVAKRVNWSRRLRQACLDVDDSLTSLVEELSRRLGVRRAVRLLVTTQPLGPVVYGPIRPTLVLPEALLAPESADRLQGIVAHELIHVRRGDLLAGMLQLVAGVLWWFHPLVWWANRQTCRQRERCCDEEVVASLGCDPGRYAQGLLDVLKFTRRSCPLFAFSGLRPVEVTARRLENIMRNANTFHRRTPRWCWGLGVVAAALVLPGQVALVASGPRASSLASPETHNPQQTEGNAASGKETRPKSPVANAPSDEVKSTGEPSELDIEAITFGGVLPQISTPEQLHREDLPRKGELKLLGEQFKDAELAPLKRWTRLHSLYLARTAITPQGLLHLKDVPSLEQLGLYGSRVTDEWLRQIRGLTKLRSLILQRTAITNAGLVHLKSLTGLESLVLQHNGITDEGLVHLKSLASISRLGIRDERVGDTGLTYLGDMTQLRSLTLKNVQVSDAGLEDVSRLKNLRWFNLGSPNVRGEGLAHLLDLKDLRQLQFTGSGATNEWLRHVEPLRSLEWLSVNSTNVTGAGLAHIAKWEKLEELYLNRNPIGDDGLVYLEGLPNLKRLEVLATRVTDEGVEKLRRILPDTHVCHESIPPPGAALNRN